MREVMVCVYSTFGGGGGRGTYIGLEGRGTYLGAGGKGTYLRWGGGTYLGQGTGVPTLDRGRGYLPWTGYAVGSMPLAVSCRRTFLCFQASAQGHVFHFTFSFTLLTFGVYNSRINCYETKNFELRTIYKSLNNRNYNTRSEGTSPLTRCSQKVEESTVLLTFYRVLKNILDTNER